MIRFRPPVKLLGRSPYRLGQFGNITSDLARTIVREAEPAVRRVIHEERNRIADALMAFVPYGAVASIAYVATSYMVPKGLPWAKTIGYGGAAATAALGAWLSSSKLEEPVVEKEPTPPPPSWLDPVTQSAAKAVIEAAEPAVRQIVDDERTRLATALQHGLPFWVASVATFLATLFFVPEKEGILKVVGYSGSTLLGGLGTWLALEKEKEAAA